MTTNYIQISNRSVLSNLLEHVSSKQLVAYLDRNDLHLKYQSIETTLTTLFSALMQEVDAGNIT